MKICVAQTRSVAGDIQANIGQHKKLIELAVHSGADMIIFPELSLTGYEPTLANNLATTADDSRLLTFQSISDDQNITIGVGMPMRDSQGVHITMVLLQPHQERITYSKKYLHPDEDPFFTPGENFSHLKVAEANVALAICYELSIPEHAENAFQSGAGIYLASVAKTESGVEKAITRLAAIARQYSMIVLMSNCIGISDGVECAGRSSVWNKEGVLIGQLNDLYEGILVVDTETEEVLARTL